MSGDKPTVPTRVEISAGGHQVVIECVGTLAAVSKRALELWHATDDPAIVRGYSAVGFQTEIGPDLVDLDDSPDGSP